LKNFNHLLQQSLLWRSVYFFTVLLLNVVVSRSLKADGSGGLFFSTIVFAFILIIVSFNLESGFTYFASSNKIPANTLALFGSFWALMVLIILLPATYYLFDYSKLLYGITALRLTYNAACFILGMMLTSYYAVLFYAKKNFFIPNVFLSIANLLLLFIFWIGPHQNVPPKQLEAIYFLFYPIQGIMLGILFFRYNWVEGNLRLPSKPELKLLFKYSGITLLGNLTFYALYKIDYLFVNRFCSETDLGNYIQAAKLGQMLLIIPQILASAIFPQISSGELQDDVKNSIIILIRIFIQIFTLIIVVVAIVGKWIFPFVFGSSFNHVYLPMLLVLPGIFALSILALLSAFFSGRGKANINLKGAILGLLLTLILDTYLVPVYGIYAAAAVSTLSYTTNLLYSLWFYNKEAGFSIKLMVAFTLKDWKWVFSVLSNKVEDKELVNKQ